jgi:prophage antirepressor-like protein
MNELKIFNNKEFGEIRVIEKDGEPWFAAKDTCDILDIKNTTQAMQRLDADEVTMLNIGGLSGETNFVNEYGLYSLVLGSRKQEAKNFKRWITHEVIPSIRKTGTYQLEPKTPIQLLELQLEALKEIDNKVDAVNKDLQDFKLDMPILGIECDKITYSVKKKGVECLGGKDAKAYNDKSIRGKIYSDIHRQLKREFAVTSYKAIKRNQTDIALKMISEYKTPFALNCEIKQCNNQINI